MFERVRSMLWCNDLTDPQAGLLILPFTVISLFHSLPTCSAAHLPLRRAQMLSSNTPNRQLRMMLFMVWMLFSAHK